MPKFNHNNLGNIQEHVFVAGIVKIVYPESSAISSNKWDTATVEYESHKIFEYAPIRYHCTANNSNRDNGAIQDAAKGFAKGDKVICMAHIGRDGSYDKMYVVAHADKIYPCTYNYVFIRISENAPKSLTRPLGLWLNGAWEATEPNSHSDEYCIIYDVANKKKASIKNPVTGSDYTFPCTVEALKPILQAMSFNDEQLFELVPQGDEQIGYASYTPNWANDIQGNNIRGGIAAKEWWTSYNPQGNPILNMFQNAEFKLVLDNDGMLNGSFSNLTEFMDGYKDKIEEWKANSPGAFNYEKKEAKIPGAATAPEAFTDKINQCTETIAKMEAQILICDAELEQIINEYNNAVSFIANMPALPSSDQRDIIAGYEVIIANKDARIAATNVQRDYYIKLRDEAKIERDNYLAMQNDLIADEAIDIYNQPAKMQSYHLQTAFGEDEIWACAKESYRGVIINYCTDAWSYVRFVDYPPVIGIDRVIPQSTYLPSSGHVGNSDQLAFAIAGMAQGSQGSTMFSWAQLKRINEGCYHRTTHPVLKNENYGSFRAMQKPIPHSPDEPLHITALNTRHEVIDIWHRADNWMNTFEYICKEYPANPTNWFLSQAMQWRIKASFIDTPIGSMWQESPEYEAGIWYMPRFSFGFPATVRKDRPLNSSFIPITLHSQRVIVQIYVAQRQAVSLWNKATPTFILQQLYKGLYDLSPADEYHYTDGVVDYNNLSDADKKNMLQNRIYRRTKYTGESGYSIPAAMATNRNEIEIMAACDLYADLQDNYGRKNPADQKRSGDFEKAIEDLISHYYTQKGLGLKDYSEFKLDAHLM